MKAVRILLGLITGFATGAVIGVLFAPNKGSKTRKNISKKTRQYANKIKETSNRFSNDIADKLQNAKDIGSRFADKWNDKTTGKKADLKDNLIHKSALQQ